MGQPEIMGGKGIFFSIPIENSNRKKKYQFIFLFTSVRKYIHFIAVKFRLWIFFSGLILIKNCYSRVVQASVNQLSSYQLSAHGPVPFKSLTSMVCLFSLESKLSSLTPKATPSQVQVH